MPADASAVKEIFLSAIDRPTAAERISYLDEACGGDTELRQRIEALLKAHAESGSFPDFAALADSGSGTESMAATPDDVTVTRSDSTGGGEDSILTFLSPPRTPENLGRLGDYEIQSVIGQGGMGVVLKAVDERLNRVVAVKILAPQYAANAAARKRFIREARNIAAVVHDHVVAVHFVSGDNDPHPYLVMQLVQGVSLQERLDATGPLEPKEILRIGLQIAQGLSAAHKHGLVHRDIKPANILLENGVERVKITDFGLARAVDDASVTTSGVIAGTPMFMSPEQAEGKPVDARSDLFSLGSVLYALCTGRPPFRATGTMAVMKRVIEDSARPVREINPDVPDWLEAIIAKLHAKKPEERFQSAKEVAVLLEQHLAHLQQPSMVPMPAKVEAPPTEKSKPVPEERPWVQLLDATDYFKRLLQQVLALLALAFVFFGVVALFSLGGPVLPAGAMVVGGVVLIIGCSLVRQKWIVPYKGRYIRFENSAITGEKLFVDGQIVARGGIAIEQEFYATIPQGPGAGDLFRVLAYAGFFSFRCRIYVREALPDVKASPSQKPLPPSRRRWRRALLPLALAVLGLAAVLAYQIDKYGPANFVRIIRGHGILAAPAMDPNVERIVIYKDGKQLGELNAAGLEVPSGDFEMEIVSRPGFHPARIEVEVQEPGNSYHDTVQPKNGRYDLSLRPGELRKFRVIMGNALPASDKELLQGTWVVDEAVVGCAEHAGQTVPPEERKQIMVVITGGQVRFHMPGGKVEGGTFKLDPAVNPKEIDIIDMKDQIGLFGIYSLYGDIRLSLRVKQDSPRPTDWASRPSASEWSLTLRRASDKERLQGTWVGVSLETSGQQIPAGMASQLSISFIGGQIRAKEMGDQPPQEGLFHLNPDSNPKEIDLIGTANRGDLIGIYRFVGDQLHLCIGETGERPKEFKADPKFPTQRLIVLRRALPEEEGWVQLFNGKDLTGWTSKNSPFGTWKVENGELIGQGNQARLRTERDNFTDFHLRIEAKHVAGASNVVIREQPDIAVKGYTIFIGNTPGFQTGALTTNLGNVALPTRPQEKELTKPDEWFKLEVIAKGNRLQVFVNGVRTTDVEDANRNFMKGFIRLGITGKDGELHVRKVEIKELPPSPPDHRTDEQELQGAWRATSMKVNGLRIDLTSDLLAEKVEQIWTFSNGKLRVKAVNRSDGDAPKTVHDECKFQLDPRATPKRITLTSTGNEPATNGIYRLDSDELTVCHFIKPAGAAQFPSEFSAEMGSNTVLMVFRRDRSGASDDDFVPLFNGIDLTGWRVIGMPANSWQVRDGILWGSGGQTYLVSDKKYNNFHLRAEYRINPTGSGSILYHANPTDAQLREGSFPCFGFDTKASELYASGGYNLELSPSKNRDRQSETQFTRPFQADEWLTLDLTVQGDRFTHKIGTKGYTPVDGFQTDTEHQSVPGPIILHLGTNSSIFEFRKLEIKELPPSSPEVPRTAAEVLPYLAGNWKLESLNRDPKSPPDKDSFVGTFAYSFVAGGKFLRGRSSVVPSSDARTSMNGLLDLWSFESDKNTVHRWVARSDGWTSPSGSGQFTPASRTLTTSVRIGDNYSVHKYEFIDANTFNHHIFRNDASGTIISEVHSKWTRVGGPVALPNVPLDPNRPAEMMVLDSLVGEWRNEITVTDMATPDKPTVETVRVKTESVLGGRFVEGVETNETTGGSDYTLSWFDADKKQYRDWFFDGRGYVFEFTGIWDEATKTLSWNSANTAGNRMEARWVFRGDDRREFRHLVKAPDGKALKEAAGVSIRHVGNVPKKAADVIPFMAGNWKVDMQVVEPKLPPEQAKGVGYQVSDYVADGKFLRVRAGSEDGSHAAFILYSYDADRDVLTFRGVWSNGNADDNILGRFNPDDRTVLWLKRLGNGNQFVHQLKFVDGNTITSRSYTQDESGKAINEVSFTFTRTSGNIALPNLPTDPKRPDEMKVLDKLVGEWRSEVTVMEGTPADKPKTEVMRTKAQPILGGRFIEEIDTIEPGNTSHYTLFWYDKAANQYRCWFFLGAGYFFESTGIWNEAVKTLTWNSVGGWLEGRWVFKSDDERKFHHLMKDKDGKALYDATGVSRRADRAIAPMLPEKSERPSASNRSIAGNWDSDWGTVTLKHDPLQGDKQVTVTGTLTGEQSNGPIQNGVYDPKKGTLLMSYIDEKVSTRGSAELNLIFDGKAMVGIWTNENGSAGPWAMRRKDQPKPDPATWNINGDWDSDHGRFKFSLGERVGKAFKVKGTLDRKPGCQHTFKEAIFEPTLAILVLTLADGTITTSHDLLLSPDGKQLTGVWANALGQHGLVTLKRVEGAEKAPAPQPPQPVKIKVFDPTKDKTATEVGITQDQGGWKIESKQKQDIVLFIVPGQGIKPEGRLVLRGQSKALAGSDGKVDSHLLWRRQNGNFGATGLVPVDTKNEWQPWTNAITLNGDASTIEIGLRFTSPGTVWLKDLELVQEPDAP
jgi:uncharacterized protein (TIGR03067 family)